MESSSSYRAEPQITDNPSTDFPSFDSQRTLVDCEKCNLIDRFLFEKGAEHIDLGSFDDFESRASICKTCRHLRDEFAQHKPKRIALFYRPRAWSDYAISETPLGKTLWIAPLEHPNPAMYRGLLVDQKWINISTIQRWLKACNESHLDSPCHIKRSWRSSVNLSNLLLLDVEQGCLRLMANTTRYFALSYVWGSLPNIFETTRQSLHRLRQPGSITPDTGEFNLPASIRDAMRLLRALGERFLWVDRLSIVQDDAVNKNIHIMNMDHIYANSYCTIIAADGTDANHGLRGIGSGSRSRVYNQHVLELASGKVLQLAGPARSSGSYYDSRGWTFQEKYLSRRCLVFSENMVSWHCQKSEWREDIKAGSASWEKPRPAHNETIRVEKWPNLPRWTDLVCQYNSRALTFPTDAQAAFAGVERTLEGSFPAGFIFGLPEFFFDAALLWQPAQPMRRRAGANGDFAENTLPSWSWLGWEGPLDITAWYPGMDYLDRRTNRSTGYVAKRNIHWEVSPLVDWVQLGFWPGAERRIRNNYHIWRRTGKSKSSRLPPGWKLHRGEGGEFYKCSAVQPDRVVFRYPLPAVDQMPPRIDRSWPPHLRLRSRLGRFNIVDVVSSRSAMMVVLLADGRGQRAGTLTLNVSKNHSPAPIGQVVDLVAISKGRAANGRPTPKRKPYEFVEELDLPDIPKRGGSYLFYNVLWVKWIDDYVVREGLGRVEQSIWERHPLEKVDVQLR